MKEEDKKWLTELIWECWHVRSAENEYQCAKCRQIGGLNHRTFTTWADFGALWEACRKKEWWEEFLVWARANRINTFEDFVPWFANKDRFPLLILQFCDKRKELFKEV
jgi:hypothetical protein